MDAIDDALGRGDHEGALQRLELLYERDPSVPAIRSRIADCLFHLGRYTDAEPMYAWLVDQDDCSVARERMRRCRELRSRQELREQQDLHETEAPEGSAILSFGAAWIVLTLLLALDFVGIVVAFDLRWGPSLKVLVAVTFILSLVCTLLPAESLSSDDHEAAG